MAVILTRNIGVDAANTIASTYPDVEESHWAIKEIEFVKSIGLMVGDDRGNFRPDAPITRGEIASIAARYKNLDTSRFNQSSFLDVETGYWGLASIEALRQAGMIAGYEDGTYKPNKNVTRAEAVKIINRMFERGPLYGVTEPSWPDVPKNHWAFNEIEEASQEHAFLPRLEGEENLVN